MPNRLAHESSPYLLQHANNPVDWHSWGPEALDRARSEGRPIFLSIGYSACHWCHVMEHESFENPAIAALMNQHFVCVKVDREERPDLDQIYMNAVQIMTGRGGWPMSVFLTPNLQPFYGGTYWPPSARQGMPGFDQVLVAVADAWQNRRQQVVEQASDLTAHLRELGGAAGAERELSPRLLESAAAALGRAFDPQYGGFGRAPKFPHPMDLRMLLRAWRRSGQPRPLEMVTLTLDRMAAGGMYDQLGGGFHRYSVDERWLVPHFEKMLYDNALLTSAYADAYLATGSRALRPRAARDVRLCATRDDRSGRRFLQHAGCRQRRGRRKVLRLDAPTKSQPCWANRPRNRFATSTTSAKWAISKTAISSNCPRPSINVRRFWAAIRRIYKSNSMRPEKKLRQSREARVHPGLDDKVLVSWNGLMIEGLCAAACALGEPRYLAAASRAADFLLAKLRQSDGRLLHSWRQGQARLAAYLDDYASLISALVVLYETGFEERYVTAAVELADKTVELFADCEAGGFFYTASDHEQLIARPKDQFDNATPSASALAATALVRLGKLTGRSDYLATAAGTFQAAAGVMQQSPTAAGQMLLALDMYLGPTPEIVIVGDPKSATTQQILADLRHRFLPNKIVALRAPDAHGSSALDPMFAGKEMLSGEPTVFICQDFACKAPVVGAEAVRQAFDQL